MPYWECALKTLASAYLRLVTVASSVLVSGCWFPPNNTKDGPDCLASFCSVDSSGCSVVVVVGSLVVDTVRLRVFVVDGPLRE